jgi:monoamine oxidase
MMTDADVAIVGAGLSGLALADALIARGMTVRVLEARRRTGGRILSRPGSGGRRYDLGPTWIWPQNARMRALAARFGAATMPQHARGKLVFQDAGGDVRRDLDFATMGDALRIPGGIASLTDALAQALPPGVLRLDAQVAEAVRDGDCITLSGTAGVMARARHAVLAMPPRVAMSLRVAPAPAPETLARMARTPTWMAGQAKLVAIYDRPFWRDAGLSGDAVSHAGPLMQIHDASAAPEPEGEAALFGFLGQNGIPARGKKDALIARALSQLTDLFGPLAASPTAVHVKAWAPDTGLRAGQGGGHPSYAPLPAALDGRLHYCGSETAPLNGGVLEGALEAAQLTLAAILDAEAAHGLNAPAVTVP